MRRRWSVARSPGRGNHGSEAGAGAAAGTAVARCCPGVHARPNPPAVPFSCLQRLQAGNERPLPATPLPPSRLASARPTQPCPCALHSLVALRVPPVHAGGEGAAPSSPSTVQEGDGPPTGRPLRRRRPTAAGPRRGAAPASRSVRRLAEGHGCGHLRLDRAAPHAAGWPTSGGRLLHEACPVERGEGAAQRDLDGGAMIRLLTPPPPPPPPPPPLLLASRDARRPHSPSPRRPCRGTHRPCWNPNHRKRLPVGDRSDRSPRNARHAGPAPARRRHGFPGRWRRTLPLRPARAHPTLRRRREGTLRSQPLTALHHTHGEQSRRQARPPAAPPMTSPEAATAHSKAQPHVV